MELGTYQLQVFISLIVILGGALVALICDFLKGNNEQLRELTIELKVRHEEEQKRMELLMPRLFAAVEGGLSREAFEVADSDVPYPAKAAKSETQPETPAGARGPELVRTDAAPHQVVEMVAASPRGPRKNWGSLLESARKIHVEGTKQTIEVNESLLEAVVAATTSSNAAKANAPALPSGFQDGFVLRQLVQSHRPISGLVVSIGVNTPGESAGSLTESVNALVQSLLGPEDFAAQSAPDEFLLIFPHERGASAQRRLGQIAQQLWDFQLRSLGTYSILFSWGGIEVRSESIDEAIASANERMMETQRGRKIVSTEILHEAV